MASAADGGGGCGGGGGGGEKRVLAYEKVVEEAKKHMFKMVMNGDWNAVVKDFEEHPEFWKEKLTRLGDTALHLAVSTGRLEILQKLVDLISNGRAVLASEILRIKNGRGNTPLHLAASSGQVKICKYIVKKDANLVRSRNHDGETPLFLAVVHGDIEAFRCLCVNRKPENDHSIYRRNDGDTILHCAINGEYFGLAFLIIQQYDELINFYNEKGFTPLHLLASKPSLFKSGSRLRLYDRIIYHCIFVDRPKEFDSHGEYPVNSGRENCLIVPDNCRTCLDFLNILKKMKDIGVGILQKSKCISEDAENPIEVSQTNGGADDGSRHKFLPPSYTTCYNFFKVVTKTLLVILGIGITRVSKIREKKEKHTWAEKIMEELVKRASEWEYYSIGQDPYKMLPGNADESLLKKEGDDYETTISDVNPSSSLPKKLEPSNPKTTEKSPDEKEERIMEVVEKIFQNFLKKSEKENDSSNKKLGGKGDTPILIAARMGIVELVKKVLDQYPVAIQDMNADGKNIVLLAVENRQPHVYKFLLDKKVPTDQTAFRIVDDKGNSALHLAATLGEYRPWLIPGAALQMQWEIKWYQFVKESKPPHYFARYNHDNRTPKEVFTESHKELVKEGGEWLINTSQSCSVVAALIATVAFATASTVPGGVNQDYGTPTLRGKPAFDVFAICSLVALCFSVTAVIVFLSILTSRYQEKDFHSDLPMKLILGLTSLFLSIASMLVSFCAGHFFVLKDELKFAAFPVYAVTCLPATYFAAVQFPLYFDLIRASIRKVPQRSYKIIRR